jgi:hypothetical protein
MNWHDTGVTYCLTTRAVLRQPCPARPRMARADQNSPLWHAAATVASSGNNVPERRIGTGPGRGAGEVACRSWR